MRPRHEKGLLQYRPRGFRPFLRRPIVCHLPLLWLLKTLASAEFPQASKPVDARQRDSKLIPES
jgi:hypothetical protein